MGRKQIDDDDDDSSRKVTRFGQDLAGLLIGTVRPRMPWGRRHFPQVLLGKMKENVSPSERMIYWLGTDWKMCVCVCWAASEFELDFFEGAVKLMAKRSLFGPLLFMFDPWGHFQQQQYGQVHSVLVFFLFLQPSIDGGT